ncbi:hypothetical protein [Streptomyces sp. NPDC091416]|uniref:hypothetical protein n=1 Tax=Streptomyces sp. NPDC091416 TaxID=3366003 RepID=UPI0038168FC4
MIVTPHEHAQLIANALADALRSDAKHRSNRRDLESIADLLDVAIIAFVDAEPADVTSAPADAVLALQDAEVFAARSPGAGFPQGFTAVVLVPLRGRAPELPAPVGAGTPQLVLYLPSAS